MKRYKPGLLEGIWDTHLTTVKLHMGRDLGHRQRDVKYTSVAFRQFTQRIPFRRPVVTCTARRAFSNQTYILP